MILILNLNCKSFNTEEPLAKIGKAGGENPEVRRYTIVQNPVDSVFRLM